MPSGVTHIDFFVHLCIILIVSGFYLGLCGRVRMVYLFSLCVVSLLSSRFTASALVYFVYSGLSGRVRMVYLFSLCVVSLLSSRFTASALVYFVYSGLSGRVRTVYLFSLCVVSLLSSRFTASALVRVSNFLKYLVFHLFTSLSTVFIYRSSWILWLFKYRGAFRMDWGVLD
jgi:hypothetical protein